MTTSVAFFSPDSHISYNIETLTKKGVGGGITARVRVAHALAKLGHRVQMFVNCPIEGKFSGVEYTHFSKLPDLSSDVFIATTSGGEMDISAVEKKQIKSKLKILFIHGEPQPRGFEQYHFDYVYAPSNFIRRSVINSWKVNPEKLFVSPHGVEEDLFCNDHFTRLERDNFKLIYAGHPSKGLQTAIEILRILRKEDQRFSLHIYGGYRLWGQDQELVIIEPGVFFHGLIGQDQLADEMMGAGFCINLQDREEPFGMVVTESMRAGCIVLASPVGAYPELVKDGINGFLVEGSHSDPVTRQKAAKLILHLLNAPTERETIREKAMHSPLTWETVAQTWEGHWKWAMNGKSFSHSQEFQCPQCQKRMISLADGLHCVSCGFHQGLDW